MENEENIDIEKMRRKSIVHAIDKYQLARYENLLKEKKLISDIIQSCGEKDVEIRKKYEELLIKLEEEKEKLTQSLNTRNSDKNDEDDLER